MSSSLGSSSPRRNSESLGIGSETSDVLGKGGASGTLPFDSLSLSGTAVDPLLSRLQEGKELSNLRIIRTENTLSNLKTREYSK